MPVATIDRELPCPACGYDLRGLARDGRCPECGGAVADALLGRTLEHADPAWLRRVQVGCWVLLAASACWPAVELVPYTTRQANRIVGAALNVLPGLAVLVGPALVSAAPRPARFDRARRLRWAMRGTAALTALALVVSGVLEHRVLTSNMAVGATLAAWQLAGVAAYGLFFTTFALAAHLLASVVRSPPRVRLARWLNVAAWWLATAALIGAALQLAVTQAWVSFDYFVAHYTKFLAGILALLASAPFSLVLVIIAAVRVGRVRRVALRMAALPRLGEQT